MLQLSNLEVAYDESTVIRDVSLSVQPGKVVCLLGRNGVGKSTIMKTIIGLLQVKRGSIQLEGEDVTKKSPTYRARRGIGYVPQGRDIFPFLTVHENLLLGLEACDTKEQKIDESLYAYFPILKEMKNRRGGDLSGGQQQQLALARALVANPKFLLLDEPTEGVQPNIVYDIQKVIMDVKKQSKDQAILLVEQSIDFAKQVGDYFYVVDKGRIAYEGDSLIEAEIKQYLSV
ncbi:urea ABC transporter ATP-binding subunit UrtE [Halalkalibacterium halodurans]|uniref:ABC transporter (ATP-binding protein) n=1 Tax=Halalkalibacterium halodurans (strain ATCC BAA-125 / DSM 18197 / FERM 7344 / JCM 9153 / C-125) TaxID=272558 RepID=Q9KG66_HALH5|nr:urea ABC transporter ATP-binding subunit UrtE [Halalkalibacterium halodurans]MDY7220760.1 urea ABC transporter ATP-binding subunit UrtE [Halalkalibacterium halodurans]MDY7239999.1 urea ABC transporter ATP-binding subunit UrtE [Halalkalibacterium halodurans]MED4082448.1 urea ABC transporter ATP-binding subunit UrtE [Halalkalibacterium halodurans]MED4084842.1 urea ABC transporter ATP-binding subunit UrtE [Halalkalibacterium halodurans]MED4103791.1 urea ABC transporter ATP-binding subunit UrtE